MPTLMVTVQVDGRPLRRTYIEHLIAGIGQEQMYMTNDQGIVCNEAGDPGIISFTSHADIRILCQNSVVKVLDGNTPGVPLAVYQDTQVVDGSVVNIHTVREQRDHYRILDRCLTTYDVVFRQFQPFTYAPRQDFPLTRKPTLRASKDQLKRIEISYPSQFPLGDLAFSEPKSIGTGYPLIHIRRRARRNDSGDMRRDRGRLFGEDGALPTLIPSELSHALHFSLFTSAAREKIQNDYIGWLASDIANGGPGTHHESRRTTPKVAFIEALDIFASRYAEFVRVVLQHNARRLEPHGHSEQIRQAFPGHARVFEVNLDPPHDGQPDDKVFVQDTGGQVVPNLRGSDREGAVYGCIFVDFASRVGLRTAVNAYFRSSSLGECTFGTYRKWFEKNNPENLAALDEARSTWGL